MVDGSFPSGGLPENKSRQGFGGGVHTMQRQQLCHVVPPRGLTPRLEQALSGICLPFQKCDFRHPTQMHGSSKGIPVPSQILPHKYSFRGKESLEDGRVADAIGD